MDRRRRFLPPPELLGIDSSLEYSSPSPFQGASAQRGKRGTYKTPVRAQVLGNLGENDAETRLVCERPRAVDQKEIPRKVDCCIDEFAAIDLHYVTGSLRAQKINRVLTSLSPQQHREHGERRLT